ncbi:MAG: DUF4349 domain-containing protein [Chloroflexota bacterium]
MQKKWILIPGLVLILILSGCAPARYDTAESAVVEKVVTVVVEEVAYAPGATGGAYTTSDISPALNQATQERMIVYTVDMEIIVKDAEVTMTELQNLATKVGGYLSGSNSWKDEGLVRARATLRVPADQLDSALAQIRDLAMDVESLNRDSQDVTEEFTDLESNLRNLRTTEEELLELLKTRQETTGETEAILEVHRYLTDIRGQIEQIQGRMNYLSNLSAMATLNIILTPDALAQPIVVGKWQPQGTAKEAIQALIKALQFLVDALIWLLLLLVPVLVVILLPLYILLRLLLNWRRKRRRPAP